MSVWGKVTGKRKSFLSLLCDGVPPYEACRKVWPKLRDVHGHVARIFDDNEFRTVYAHLMDHQSSREQLLFKCLRIAEDKDTASDSRIAAIKTAATLRGYIEKGRPSSKVKPKLPLDDDKVLLDRMAELGRKAYDEKRRPS